MVTVQNELNFGYDGHRLRAYEGKTFQVLY